MHLRTAAIACVLLVTSGCATMTPQQLRAADVRTCRDYGFRPNTEAFAECLQRIDLSRDADRRARFHGDGFYGRGYGIGIGIGTRL